MGSRAVLRTAFLLFFTAIAIVSSGVDIVAPWHPYSTFGYSADRAGRVTAVDASAARAGLRVGDRIDVRALPPLRRAIASFVPLAPQGAAIDLHLASGRTVRLISHLYPRSPFDDVTDVVEIVVGWIYIALAALLVMLRPMPSTWAFYAFSYVFCFVEAASLAEYAPLALTLSLDMLLYAAASVAPAAFVSFALRFPDAQPQGLARTAERILLYGVVPVFLAWNVVTGVLYIANAWLAPNVTYEVFDSATYAIFAIAIVTLIARYVTAPAESRNRLQWVVAGLTIAFLPFLVMTFMEDGLGLLPPIWYINVATAWIIFAPLAIAYTVLRHRLFDMRLIVSRALLYTIVTTLMVGVLALIDWAFGRLLAQSRFALVGELALALLLGFSLMTVHRRIEAFLNGIIFRAKTVALEALRRFTQEVDLISDPHRLMTQTFDALQKRLESEYVAIYTADGSAYTRVTPGANSTPTLLPSDDFTVLRLRRWSEPFECDEPEHLLRGALLVPMMARAQLVGFVVCGPKRDRTHYLPDEIETLSALAHRTGSAYAWLTLRPLETPVSLAPEPSS